jgi:hypothetical protein
MLVNCNIGHILLSCASPYPCFNGKLVFGFFDFVYDLRSNTLHSYEKAEMVAKNFPNENEKKSAR